jgi:hypothetical protein
VFTKRYEVAANSRHTIRVNSEEIAGHGLVLANVVVSMAFTSTNGVSFVAERVMWFPSPRVTSAFWTDAHASPGVTTAATQWAVADVVDGGDANTQTFLLVANASDFAGRIEVLGIQAPYWSYLYEGILPAQSRLTLPVRSVLPAQDGTGPITSRSLGILVRAIGPGPLAQIVVERSTYWDPGGAMWAAGTNVLATPVP